MGTALMLSYSQIVDGGSTCVYCDDAATVMLATGADPEPEPLCWKHASQMIDASLTTGGALFGAMA